ncbi:DUF6942 family protein [Neptuniibacter marinus]|uniref:DUF6942 family protein n=1 Tax=Neptuniibacter marinus TaxID=1806670 RepID=UPI003B5A9242
MVGFGAKDFNLAIYIANRPPLDDYQNLSTIKALRPEEAHYIGQATGNHWRKIFNVSAKFLFELYQENKQFDATFTWQDYRDTFLFQAESREALLFSPPSFEQADTIHIVAGKAYAKQLKLAHLTWLDEHFAVSTQQPLILCPYLDYRQLSNARITQLVALVRAIRSGNL